MARDRTISNPLALAVLVLLYERPMHPYEMATTLRERRKEQSIKLRFGSLYSVIDRMEQEGLIVAGETVREGNRPERTIYHITDTGKAEMRDWLREIVRRPVKEYPQFEAGLSLLPALPPEEAIDMLQQRLSRLDQTIEEVKAEIDQAHELGLHPLLLIETDYRLNMLGAERRWTAALVQRMTDEDWGAAEMVEGAPTWKQMHEERES